MKFKHKLVMFNQFPTCVAKKILKNLIVADFQKTHVPYKSPAKEKMPNLACCFHRS